MGRFARIAADQREREAAQALQATWRIAIARIVMNRRRRAQRHRTRVVNELLQTERSYKRSIGVIAEHFIVEGAAQAVTLVRLPKVCFPGRLR